MTLALHIVIFMPPGLKGLLGDLAFELSICLCVRLYVIRSYLYKVQYIMFGCINGATATKL